jgi:hypothetical protein
MCEEVYNSLFRDRSLLKKYRMHRWNHLAHLESISTSTSYLQLYMSETISCAIYVHFVVK